MKVVTLKPRDSRTKRLIHDFGERWLVVRGPVPMHCFDGGMGVLCRPEGQQVKFSNFQMHDLKESVASDRAVV
jgi:hypothetical protein